MKIQIIRKLASMFILLGLSFYSGSCSNDIINPGSNNGESRVNTTIVGTVVEEDGSPISGVVVTMEGQSKTTGNNGQFFFENVSVPSDRLYIKASFAGYFDGSSSAKPNADASTLVQIRMLEKDNIQTISGATGGTVSLTNGSSVQIMPNSLELLNGTPYTGSVNIAIEHLDPTSQLFPLIIPGGDLTAKRSDSSNAILFSYGMLIVELTGSGNEQLRIKSGQSSTLTTSIPAVMVSGAPSSIPLWYFDEVVGIWREDGSAVKQGNNYVGNVSHFSIWNCDVPGNRALLKGRLIDCNSNPLTSVSILTGQGICFTNSQGYFQRYVPTSIQFDVSVNSLSNYGLYSSPQVNVGPFINEEVFNMGDLQIDCPSNTAKIKGRVVCSGQSQNAIIFIRNAYDLHTAVTSNGDFEITGKPNTMYSLTIQRLNGVSFSTGVTTQAAGNTVDIGDVVLCNTPAVIGDNGYIIDGDGFIDDVIGFSVPYTSASYDEYNNSTHLYVGDISDSTRFISILFTGNQPGSYQATNVYFRLLGNDYILNTQTPQFNVIITDYGQVNEFITGTFSGTLFKNATSNSVDISDGKFKVLRSR